MRRLAIKVHRACTTEEVATLSRLGVDYVGFDADESAFYGFDADPLWDDERHVLEAMLPELIGALDNARPVVELPAQQLAPDAPARMARIGATLIQVGLDFLPDDAFADACAVANAALVYDRSYIEASRPADWIDIGDPDRKALAFYEADFFPTSYDPLAALVDPIEGALGLTEIDEIARRAPLFVAIGATPDSIGEIARRLAETSVAGLAFRLSEYERDTYYSYRFEELVEVLEALPRPG